MVDLEGWRVYVQKHEESLLFNPKFFPFFVVPLPSLPHTLPERSAPTPTWHRHDEIKYNRLVPFSHRRREEEKKNLFVWKAFGDEFLLCLECWLVESWISCVAEAAATKGMRRATPLRENHGKSTFRKRRVFRYHAIQTRYVLSIHFIRCSSSTHTVRKGKNFPLK